MTKLVSVGAEFMSTQCKLHTTVYWGCLFNCKGTPTSTDTQVSRRGQGSDRHGPVFVEHNTLDS
jgi:hypothetical protein